MNYKAVHKILDKIEIADKEVKRCDLELKNANKEKRNCTTQIDYNTADINILSWDCLKHEALGAKKAYKESLKILLEI